jgi:hypothetical protein
MTPLTKNLCRLVPREPRPLVVVLEPADPTHDVPAQVAIRELGCRTWFRLPVGAIYLEAVRRTLEARRAEKRKSRRTVRRSLI